jgi:hypothetical protein
MRRTTPFFSAFFSATVLDVSNSSFRYFVIAWSGTKAADQFETPLAQQKISSNRGRWKKQDMFDEPAQTVGKNEVPPILVNKPDGTNPRVLSAQQWPGEPCPKTTSPLPIF